MNERQHRRRVVTTSLMCRDITLMLWDTPLGLSLVEAFYDGDGFTTAGHMAERMEISDDTTRRELDRLLSEEKVELEIRGRTRWYRARPDLAAKTTELLGKNWLDLATDLLSFCP